MIGASTVEISQLETPTYTTASSGTQSINSFLNPTDDPLLESPFPSPSFNPWRNIKMGVVLLGHDLSDMSQ
jgi:hypothetical protein